MEVELVVVRAFGGYGRGDVIADGTTVMAILADERARNVVRISRAAAPLKKEG